MKINFFWEIKKQFIELIPSILISWGYKKGIMISWLWFGINITLK